jgi:hypothetical protein
VLGPCSHAQAADLGCMYMHVPCSKAGLGACRGPTVSIACFACPSAEHDNLVREVSACCRAARQQADSSPLPVAREALCGAVANVLSVLCLHMRLVLDDDGLATLPPPPPQLCQSIRTLPAHLLSSAEGQPANVWISLLFDRFCFGSCLRLQVCACKRVWAACCGRKSI